MDEREALTYLGETLKGVNSVLVLPHNDPDPDAIASAAAVHHLLDQGFGVQSQIRYGGIIGRAENRALVDYLNRDIDALHGTPDSRPVILVDTQPGVGNNPLVENSNVLAVFDHHPLRAETAKVSFADVRAGVGACATILTRYLQAAAITPPRELATALFYGIKSDTMALGRNVTAADVDAYVYLQALVDPDALMEIEQAQVPPAYFRSINAALEAARVYGDVLIADLGAMAYPDLVAELADWLLRLQGVDWVICMGVYRDSLRIAVRTRSHRGGAGQMAQAIVAGDGMAGGHGTMAGGQIALNGAPAPALVTRLRRRILDYFDIQANSGRRLMTLKPEE